MRKKILFSLMCISMIFPMSIYAKKKEEIPGSAIFVMASQKQVILTEKMLEHVNEIAKIHIKIPQIHGLTDRKFEKFMNNDFEKKGHKLKKEILKDANESYKAYEETKDKAGFIPYEVIQNYTNKESCGEYLTLSIFSYIYTGGAHGLTYQDYITINKQENKIITLKDFFKEEKEYKEKINKEIKEQINKRKCKGDYFFEGVGAFDSITPEQVFYLNEKGDLVIVFNIYEIAPYASGILEFTIPVKAVLGQSV